MSKFYQYLQNISVVVFFPMLFAFSAFGQNRDLQTDLNDLFIKYDLIQLESRAARRSVENRQTLKIAADRKNFELILTARDFRSPRYKAEDAGANGVRELEKSAITTFKGKVSGQENSEVRLTIDDAKIEGYFETGGERFFIEPARKYSRFAAADDLVIYRSNDLLKKDGFACEMEEKIERGREMVAPNVTSAALALRVIELATEADFEYLAEFANDPARANAEILSVLNMVEGVYESELGLTFAVVYQHTWTTQDPFTGGNRQSLLVSFQNYWNANFPASQIPRDTAHFFSGKNVAVGGGHAYISVICSNPAFAYGLSGYVGFVEGRLLITAHEIGHNLGARHADAPQSCENSIMNTSLTGSTPLSFCAFSRTEMTTFVNANGSCLSNLTFTRFDFDGDAKADLSIFRPLLGEWWYLRSSDAQNRAFRFGNSNDRIVPADYTGDGKTDVAIFRPSSSEWFVLRSEDNSFYSFPFGTSGDMPAPADFDGDGRADAAVFRASNTTWYISRSTGGTTIEQFGAIGDVPAVADYDGDNRADIAIFRPSNGQWWLSRSTSGVIAFTFGDAADKPVSGDYTGDGKADIAIWRPASGEWFVLRSENNSFYSFPFGAGGDTPAPADFDGDGKIDAAVFRPTTSTWYVQRTTAGTLIQTFGIIGDKPVPSAFVP